MNIGIGIDIVFVPAISEGLTEYGNEYLKKFCTDQEINYCVSSANPALHAAARFAAKEAAMKALTTGWAGGVQPLHFEVIKEESGKPELVTYDRALELLKEKGIRKTSVSLSHSEEYAIAIVIFED